MRDFDLDQLKEAVKPLLLEEALVFFAENPDKLVSQAEIMSEDPDRFYFAATKVLQRLRAKLYD